jgi:hypothetical protein
MPKAIEHDDDEGAEVGLAQQQEADEQDHAGHRQEGLLEASPSRGSLRTV